MTVNEFFTGLASGATWAAGVAFQRSNPLPLDKYSVFEKESDLITYVTTNAVAYPGQIVAVYDETTAEMTAYVICSVGEDGTYLPIGTETVVDGKSIAAKEDGSLELSGFNAAAGLTFPQKQADGSIRWVTVSEFVQGDGDTKYSISMGDDNILHLIGNDESDVEVDLSKFLDNVNTTYELSMGTDHVLHLTGSDDSDTEVDLNGFFDDTNTTYELSQNGMAITLTPSEGEANTVTIDAYTKSEIDDKFDALPEDQDTQYTAKADDKVLKLTGTEFSTEISLKHENGRISLTGIDGVEIAGFSDAEFVEDGVLQDVSYDATTKVLTFTWNIVEGEDEDGNIVYKTDEVNIADLIDTYTAGNGLELTNSQFSIKLDSASEEFLTVGANGVKLAGVQSAIDTAKQAAIDDAAQKYAVASNVYTKEEANGLLNAKANATDVYTKEEANGLLNAKANSADVYTKEEANDLLDTKVSKKTTAFPGTYAIFDENGDIVPNGIIDVSNVVTTEMMNELVEIYYDLITEETDEKITVIENAYAKSEDVYTDDEVDALLEPITSRLAELVDVESGAQVNVIESVAHATDNKVTVTTTGKTVTIDDSALRADVLAAHNAANAAQGTANDAKGLAEANALLITANDSSIKALQEANTARIGEITALQEHDQEHTGQYNALVALVEEHGTKITELDTGKVSTSAHNELAGKVTANTEAIATLNTTTIPGINAEVANKISKKDNGDLIAYNLVMFDENGDIVDSQIRAEKVVDEESLAGTLGSWSGDILTETDNKISSLQQVYATKEELKSTDDLAKATDEKLTAFLGSVTDPDATQGVIDTLEEIQKYMTDDTEAFTRLSVEVENNTESINGVMDTVAQLNNYIDIVVPELNAKIFSVDDKTIKLTEATEDAPAKAYVAEVSTDILVQGTQTLVFCAGTASTVI